MVARRGFNIFNRLIIKLKKHHLSKGAFMLMMTRYEDQKPFGPMMICPPSFASAGTVKNLL